MKVHFSVIPSLTYLYANVLNVQVLNGPTITWGCPAGLWWLPSTRRTTTRTLLTYQVHLHKYEQRSV